VTGLLDIAALAYCVETFLPWDLDSLFVSTMVLVLTRFVDERLLDSRSTWAAKAFVLLDTMIASGNRIAEYRMRELRKLEEMLSEYSTVRAQQATTSVTAQSISNHQQPGLGLEFSAGIETITGLVPSQDTAHLHTSASDGNSGFGDELTAEQILAFTESMDIEGTDWMAFAAIEDFPIPETPVS
jgi:proline utilization trans-activator